MCALVGADGVSLWSRQGKNLTRYFPDLLEAVAGEVPPGCVLDGEAVVWTADRLDFDALQRRLVASKAALPALVRERPASFVAFDLLAVAGYDIRDAPLAERRELLEQLAADWEPPLNLSPMTRDRAQALRWFDELHLAGLEGLVVKGAGQSYQPVRQWLVNCTKRPRAVGISGFRGCKPEAGLSQLRPSRVMPDVRARVGYQHPALLAGSGG